VDKVDGAGTRLPGAKFEVSPGQTTNSTTAAKSEMVESSTAGRFCLDDLLLGVEYTITETQAPTGYVGESPKTFTVTAASTCADRLANGAAADRVFVNQPATRQVTLIKHDHLGAGLAGATFTLTPGNHTCTSTAGGDCDFGQIPPGTYTLTETVVPAGYNGHPTLPQQVTVPIGNDPHSLGTFVNSPATRQVTLIKHDDDANGLTGAVFTLTPGNHTCTSTGTGACDFGQVPPGAYTLTETTVPSGYTGDSNLPTQVNVPIGAGAHSLGIYTNTQLHSVLVIVCHQASGKLAPSGYDGKTSPSAGNTGGISEADLCALANAQGITGVPHGNNQIAVNVAH
jgi:uncharacterized surface anchored protein